MRLNVQTITMIIFALLASACSSFPAKKNVTANLFSDASVPNMTYEEMAKTLTTGVNNLGAGYSAKVFPITRASIHARQTELGKTKMDPQDKIDSEIRADLAAFTDKKTCFMVSVSTYEIEEAMFKSWHAKFSSKKDGLVELKFMNLRGVESVPEAYKDMDGRRFHNTSAACADKSLNLIDGFKVHLIPLYNHRQGDAGNSELEWIVGGK